MRRFISMIVAVGLTAAACGGSPAGSLGPAPTLRDPSPTQSGPTGGAPGESPTDPTRYPSGAPAEPFTFEVWLVRDGTLFVGSRTEPFKPAVAALALEALLDGPTNQERDEGVRTAIPAGTTGTILDLSDGTASVVLSETFFAGPDQRLRQAQVVYTLTQYDTIEDVALLCCPGDDDLIGSATTRSTFEELLPAILVEDPAIGEPVDSPVTVSGSANVFEATVSVRIVDEAGREIARTFTTATCGTGCRGDYSVSVRYEVDREQPGTIEVYESSAVDGTPVNVQSIPVLLTP